MEKYKKKSTYFPYVSILLSESWMVSALLEDVDGSL